MIFNRKNLAGHFKHPDSKDSFYPVEFENTIYDCFNLKVIFDREKTGFEESKVHYSIMIGFPYCD